MIKKLKEHTAGLSIYMLLEIDGKQIEVTNYCGSDYQWNDFKTSVDGTPDREKAIIAFKKLY